MVAQPPTGRQLACSGQFRSWNADGDGFGSAGKIGLAQPVEAASLFVHAEAVHAEPRRGRPLVCGPEGKTYCLAWDN